MLKERRNSVAWRETDRDLSASSDQCGKDTAAVRVVSYQRSMGRCPPQVTSMSRYRSWKSLAHYLVSSACLSVWSGCKVIEGIRGQQARATIWHGK